MGDIKLIALDMDGTLLNDQGQVTEKNRETLRRAAEAGVALAIATGRAYTELPIEMLYDVGVRYAITGNGSAVYKLPDQECMLLDGLENEVLFKILEEFQRLDIYYDVFVEGKAYCPKSVCHNIRKMDMPTAIHEHVERTRIVVDDLIEFLKTFGKQVEKATANFAYLEDGTCLDRDATAEILSRYPQVKFLSGGYHNLEFTRAGVTKGTGIRFLAERLGVDMKQTMACGDSENDYDMLKEVQYAVAMGNATEYIKNISKILITIIVTTVKSSLFCCFFFFLPLFAINCSTSILFKRAQLGISI